MSKDLYNLNGGAPLDGLKDHQIEALVRGKLLLAESVSVQTVRREFCGFEGEMRGRKITFYRSVWSQVPEIVRAFFTDMFSPEGAPKRYEVQVGGSLITEYLLGGDLEKADIDQAKLELEGAYNRCSEFTMYISDDCNHVEIGNVSESNLIALSRKGGRVVRSVAIRTSAAVGDAIVTARQALVKLGESLRNACPVL